MLGQIVWIAIAVIHNRVALGVEGFGERLLVDIILSAVLEDDVGQVQQHIA